jgi:hypothetical protein
MRAAAHVAALNPDLLLNRFRFRTTVVTEVRRVRSRVNFATMIADVRNHAKVSSGLDAMDQGMVVRMASAAARVLRLVSGTAQIAS